MNTSTANPTRPPIVRIPGNVYAVLHDDGNIAEVYFVPDAPEATDIEDLGDTATAADLDVTTPDGPFWTAMGRHLRIMPAVGWKA